MRALAGSEKFAPSHSVCRYSFVVHIVDVQGSGTGHCLDNMQAGNTDSIASFQRVTCALLHLMSLLTFANTVLYQCYNPIFTVVESSLDMHKVCRCVLDLSKQGLMPASHCTPVSHLYLCEC